MRSCLGAWLSPNPARAAVERWWLMFTPIWAGLMGVVMLSGVAVRWGDGPCLALGLLLAGGALLPPILGRTDTDRPLLRSVAVKSGLAVLLLAFGLNYTQTPFFFDVLHMHYGFGTTLNIRNNPFFLYLVSVAYFATYFSLCSMAFRALSTGALRPAAWLLAPLAMAFLETALNANPFMGKLFCYDDLPFMLWFGTLAYGMAFVYALPVWMMIDDAPGVDLPLHHVAAFTGAALYLDLISLDLLRFHVAPRFTTVVEGAVGLRDFGHGCLVLP